MTDEEQTIADFDSLGEAKVRELYEKERLTTFKRRIAAHWLAERDRAASVSANSDIARSAFLSAEAAERSAAAAERQAEAAVDANAIAKTANTIATIAIIMAVLAMAVSIIGLFLQLA
jgi:hypothetical protein